MGFKLSLAYSPICPRRWVGAASTCSYGENPSLSSDSWWRGKRRVPCNRTWSRLCCSRRRGQTLTDDSTCHHVGPRPVTWPCALFIFAIYLPCEARVCRFMLDTYVLSCFRTSGCSHVERRDALEMHSHVERYRCSLDVFSCWKTWSFYRMMYSHDERLLCSCEQSILYWETGAVLRTYYHTNRWCYNNCKVVRSCWQTEQIKHAPVLEDSSEGVF